MASANRPADSLPPGDALPGAGGPSGTTCQTLHLALHRQGQTWTADLEVQPGVPARHFSSLHALLAYLGRLGSSSSAKGLR